MSIEPEANYYTNYSNYFPSHIVPHGCDILISCYHGSCKISHTTCNSRTTPKIRSHKDGMRIGCTFVSNDALEEIYKLHKKFQTQESMDHQ